MGPSPLRRSDRGKKMAEVSGLPVIKSKEKKSANSALHGAGDVNEVKENGRQDSNVSDRKRKKFTIHHYKALLQPQRIRIEIGGETAPIDDPCGSDINNSLSADDTIQTFLETENVFHQVQQHLDTGVEDKDEEFDLSSLAETTTGQLGEITLEDSLLDPHNEMVLPSSTDPLVRENQSNILPLCGLLVEHSTEPTLIVSQSGESLEERLVAAETPLGEHESSFPLSDAPPLPPPVNPLDRLNNLNQVGARTPNHGDPLQAELKRLCTVNQNLTQSYEVNKQKLNSECDNEITEAITQIRLKYEAKHQEADAAFHAYKKELDTYLNRVHMNRILAEAFRAMCQDLTPPVRLGMQQVSQPGLMQQLHRVSGPSSVRRPPCTASTSLGQAPGSQQTIAPPPLPPSMGSDGQKKGKSKKVEGQPSKNLMSERRRRKRLNDRLSMLRSIVPKISKMDRTSILGDTIDYMKELMKKIQDLKEQESEAQYVNQLKMVGNFEDFNMNESQFQVERGDTHTRIKICCSTKPGLLLSNVNTFDAVGLDIQQCVMSCFNDFSLQACCSEAQDHRSMISCEDLKQVLLKNAGYGGRCL